MHLFARVGDFLSFYKSARTPHDVHSPALFGMLHAIFDGSGDDPNFNKIERIRGELLHNQLQIETPNLGAPSLVQKTRIRSVSQEARGSLSPDYQGRWLYRLVKHLQPGAMLELGTSFGLSTLYQHLAQPSAPIHTVEGSNQIAGLARQQWQEFEHQTNIHLTTGLFDDVLGDLPSIFDYIFIDGDHRSKSLLRYMEVLRPKSRKGCVYVLHDIHWSKDMLQGWQEVIMQPYVTASIDLYHLGIVLTDNSISTKQHLSIVPTWMKPWRMGIWG